MAKTRAQKKADIELVTSDLANAASLVVVHNKGMTVAEVSELRRAMRASGSTYRVTKNRLTKLAIEGTKFAHIADMLKGPTVLAYSQDPVAPAKTIVEYAKKNEKLVVLGGAYGEQKLDVKGVEALATLPSLDELRGKIVGLLQAPAQKILGVLQAPAGQVARVIGAHAKKDQ